MTDDGSLYRIDGTVYTYGELRDATKAEAATLPPEQWRDGVFNVRDYIIEAVYVRSRSASSRWIILTKTPDSHGAAARGSRCSSWGPTPRTVRRVHRGGADGRRSSHADRTREVPPDAVGLRGG